MMRRGVVQAVEACAAIEVVGEAADGSTALRKIRTLEPDVALLDMRMGEPDGLDVLAALLEEGSSTRVLFLSAYVDGAVVHKALAEGAAGFLPKDTPADQLPDALLRAGRGEIVVARELAGEVCAHVRADRLQESSPLSERETEVLERLAAGAIRTEIAGDLHVSESTVKTNLQRLYHKLGVSTRSAAVAEGMRRGLVR